MFVVMQMWADYEREVIAVAQNMFLIQGHELRYFNDYFSCARSGSAS